VSNREGNVTVARGLGWPGAASAGEAGGARHLGWPTAAVPRETVPPGGPGDPTEAGAEPAADDERGSAAALPPGGGGSVDPAAVPRETALAERRGLGQVVPALGPDRADHDDPPADAPTALKGTEMPGIADTGTDVDAEAGAVGRSFPVDLLETDVGEEARRALAESLPTADDSTPLAMSVAEDARRRIELHGRRFPPPTRTRVMTVANQKGGVGKTTTTVNLAAALALHGARVLVVDLDPQGNASTALGIDHHSEVPSIYDVLVEGRPLSEVVQACPDVPNLWCAPATIDLAGAEIELVSMVARETRLRTALERYLEETEAAGGPRVDYVLVDCPPSLGLLTVNAFCVAREVLIPIQCEYYALEGLSQLLKNIELIRAHLNPELHVSTILLTMYDARTRLAAQVAEEVRTHFPDTVLRTSVPRSVRISEAPSHQQTVMTYDPGSSGALSYLSAAREIAERGAVPDAGVAGGSDGASGTAQAGSQQPPAEHQHQYAGQQSRPEDENEEQA
jgi:chromosome partitioning protein